MRLLVALLISSGSLLATASYCGESSIPFSFEALQNGQPVLGCARPTCFGWTAEGRPITMNAQFYRVQKVPDGFLRKNTVAPLSRRGEDAANFKPQTAICDGTFERSSCSRDNQWVGGIGPIYNATLLPLAMQCCSYDILRLSSDRGVAAVRPGQIVIGGEVMKDGRQYAFDYISDVMKNKNADGSVSYDISMRRFPCIPVPSEASGPADESVRFEILKKFDRSQPIAPNHIAFQAPISQVGSGPLQQIGVQETIERVVEQPVRVAQQQVEGPFPVENTAIIEQVPAQQFIQVPQPQPVPQQPVFFQQPQPAPVAAQPQYYAPAATGGGGGGYYCFSADTKVRMHNGEVKRMDELKVADWVLTESAGKTTYTRVDSWLHRLPEQESEFHRLGFEDGDELKLTALHYIYKTECDSVGVEVSARDMPRTAVRAEELAVGDCVFKLNEDLHFVKERIESIEIVKDTGIYAPLTSTGNIVVNDVHASCHAVVNSHILQNTFFQTVDRLRRMAAWAFKEVPSHMTDIPSGTELMTSMLALVLPEGVSSL